MKKNLFKIYSISFSKKFILFLFGFLFTLYVVQAYTVIETNVSNILQVIQRILITTDGTQSGAIVADFNTGGNIIFYTGNDVLFATDNINKRIGINTIAPTSSLDVSGNVRIRTIPLLTTALSGILVVDANGSVSMTGSYGLGLAAGQDTFLQFNDHGVLSGSSYLVRSGGRLGVGTSTPNALLQVSGYINFDDTNYSTYLGYRAGISAITSAYTVGIGYQALYANSTGNYNLAVGSYALYNTVGDFNLGLGTDVLRNTTLGYANIGIGKSSLYTNITGNNNIGIGYNALYTTQGSYNIGLGVHALYLNMTGNNNIGIGYNALYNILGNNNVGLGHQSLYYVQGANNVGVGAFVANMVTGASNNNVFLGPYAGPSTSQVVNNRLYIHNAAGVPLIYGKFDDRMVGINTDDPQVALDVNGAIKISTESQLTGGIGEFCDGYVGTIKYVEIDNVGHFLGCINNGSDYVWIQMDN